MMVSNVTPGANQNYTQVYNPVTGRLENRLSPEAKRRRQASRTRRKIREAREAQRQQDLEEIRQTSRAVQGKPPQPISIHLQHGFSVPNPIPKTGSAFLFLMSLVSFGALVAIGIGIYEILKDAGKI